MLAECAFLPEDEFRRLKQMEGRVCTRIRFCAMRDCGEDYLGSDPSGFHELTWGIAMDFHNVAPICISWAQDSLGNPNRLAAVVAERVLSVDSVVVQDVSNMDPWAGLIGAACRNVTPHLYSSNYAPAPSSKTWHPVLWGLEFHFDTQSFLAAAALHGHFLTDPLVNDELVLAYTPAAVRRLAIVRDGHREEWGERDA